MTVYDHTEPDKPKINWLSLTLSILAIILLFIVIKRLSEIKEADQRELYIESQHSELK